MDFKNNLGRRQFGFTRMLHLQDQKTGTGKNTNFDRCIRLCIRTNNHIFIKKNGKLHKHISLQITIFCLILEECNIFFWKCLNKRSN